MHCRTTRAKGNLDQHASGLLSVGPNDLLGVAQIRRLGSVPVSPPERADPRGICGTTLAGASTTRGQWRVVGRGTMGAPPGDGAISRLGD
jgi:hypothetical protein